MIDDDIDGKENVVRPPIGSYHVNYQQVEIEYHEIDGEIDLNKKQIDAIKDKHIFFEKLKNESTAYLNCLSEKMQIIDKYIEMDLHLRQNRHNLIRKNECFNTLEAYQEAFYPNDYIKDINAAKAYHKLSNLNDTLNKDNIDGMEEKNNDNQTIFDVNDEDIWNDNESTLNKRNYLLQKKKRSEYREKNGMHKKRKLNISIEDEYIVKREKLLNEMKSIFDDTRIEYKSFETMGNILEEWKKRYQNEYKQAWISVSVPKLIAPFVKLQLIEWNALKYRVNIDKESDDQSTIIKQPKLFINLKWYQLISNYGTDNNGEMNGDDPDDIIVPTLIAKLVIPELVNIIKYDWNPSSKQETKQLLLQINCAIEHIDGYKQLETQKELISVALKQRCHQIVNDLIELKCIPYPMIKKYFQIINSWQINHWII